MTPSGSSLDVHPIYNFIVIGRENEIVSPGPGYDIEDMSDSWMVMLSDRSGCSAFFEFFEQKPSMVQAEEVFFSDECECVYTYWLEQACAARDSELMVALRKKVRISDGLRIPYRLPYKRSDEHQTRAIGIPKVTDDARSRILFTLGSGLFSELSGLARNLVSDRAGLDTDSVRAVELCLTSTRAMLESLPVAGVVDAPRFDAENDASVYAGLVGRRLDEQLLTVCGHADEVQPVVELLRTSFRPLREELRIHTEITVECFITPMKSDGKKARASQALLIAAIDGLETFLSKARVERGALSLVDSTELRIAIRILELCVAETNRRLGASVDRQALVCLQGSLRDEHYGECFVGDISWPEGNSIVTGVLEKFSCLVEAMVEH